MKKKDFEANREGLSKTGWHELLGHQVEIYKDGRLVRIGYVEDVMASGDGLWLEARGVDHRELFVRAEGYLVGPLSK